MRRLLGARSAMRATGIGLVLACATAATALAEDPAHDQPADDRGWEFTVAPYLWAASLDGDVGIGPLEADVDVGFIDILKDLSLAGMLHAEARNGDLGGFANLFFVRTKDESSGDIDVDVKNDTAYIALGGFYRVYDWQWGESAGGEPLRLAVEPYAGLRWSYLRAEIEPSGGPVNLPQADRSESFVDPLVGLRLASRLTERWSAFVAADGGGFGVGSDYSWNVQAHARYRLSVFGTPASLDIGYRALHQKYDDDDFEWDVTTHGPILGLAFAF